MRRQRKKANLCVTLLYCWNLLLLSQYQYQYTLFILIKNELYVRYLLYFIFGKNRKELPFTVAMALQRAEDRTWENQRNNGKLEWPHWDSHE